MPVYSDLRKLKKKRGVLEADGAGREGKGGNAVILFGGMSDERLGV